MKYLPLLITLSLPFNAGVCRAEDSTSIRRFELSVDCQLTELPAGEKVQLWLPEPLSGSLQNVQTTEVIAPAETRVTFGKKYANQFRYLTMDAPSDGKVRVQLTYQVTRRGLVRGEAVDLGTSNAELWLKSNRLVPVASKQLNGLRPKPSETAIRPASRHTARKIYDRVLDHVEYRKDEPGYGRGDTLWVCDSRFGNCTDFHSLFISLARTEGIPARFEIGLPLPYQNTETGTIGGYHCWAWFHEAGRGWVPVDISEADKHPEKADELFGGLPPNRISFSVGRDLVLEPPQQGPPLNFFVYPYAEAGGRPVPQANLSTTYAWRRSDKGAE